MTSRSFVVLGVCLLSLSLSRCASKETKTACAPAATSGEEAASTAATDGATPTCSASTAQEPVFRYIASVEGDYNTDYQPDRTVAETKLHQWEGKVPDVSDTANYFDYLSTLDAAGHGPEAEKKIKSYLAEHPTDTRAVFLLAVHYMRLQRKELASYFFRQLEKNPEFVWKSLLFNNLGMLALQEKDRAQAIEYFEKATAASPPTAAPFVNLGALYLQSRSYTDAEAKFARAVQLDGDFEDAALGLGASLEAQGKFDPAHKAYGEYLASHPASMSVLYNDALILGNRLKQREEAAQMMLRYIQGNGKETAKAHEIIQSWR